jgi:tyrosine-protein phosphatase YwqE
MAHLIASDSHSDRWRPPGLAAAFRRAAELAGPEYAAWMAGAAWQVIRDVLLALPSPGAEACDTRE